MSWRSPAWGVLGIEPTGDQGAIRRAYAARLKAIDPDRDPQAFIALREAFEEARSEAQWHDEADAEDGDETDAPDFAPEAGPDGEIAFDIASADAWFGTGVSLAPPAWPSPDEPAAEPAQPAAPRGPWTPLAPADYDAHAQALLELLDRPEDAPPEPPTPEQAEAMLAHWRVLAADPRLQQMGHFADVERWIAGALAFHTPASDPLVRPVTDLFGWMASADEIGQAWDVAFLVQRRRVLDFADALDEPGHPLHAAWIELTTPADERSRRGRVKRDAVDRLLAIVRRDYPELEERFDGDRVARWTKKRLPGWVGTIGWWFLIIIAIQAFHLTKCASDPSSPLAVTGPRMLEDAKPDIDRALLLAYDGKLSLAVIDAKNPDLAAALRDQWRRDGAARKPWASFAISVGELLDQRYRGGLDRAPLPVLRAHQRYQIAEIQWMQSVDREACGRALQGGKFDTRLPTPPLLEAQRKALVVQVLLETRPVATPPAKSRNFAVPGTVIDKAAERAAMPRDALARAMRFEGPVADQCKARIAFIETVLALPDKRAEPLLRTM